MFSWTAFLSLCWYSCVHREIPCSFQLSSLALEFTVWDFFAHKPSSFLGEVLLDLHSAPLREQTTWFRLEDHDENSSSLPPPTPRLNSSRSVCSVPRLGMRSAVWTTRMFQLLSFSNPVAMQCTERPVVCLVAISKTSLHYSGDTLQKETCEEEIIFCIFVVKATQSKTCLFEVPENCRSVVLLTPDLWRHKR